MLAKKCLLVGIFTLLSVSLAIADPPAVHPTTGEPLVIDCLRGTPDAIDGDLSDWNLEAMTPAVLDVVEQLHSGQDSWDSPEDCSGEFYLLWDDENIYIAVVMKDDVLSMNKTGGDIWNADVVEVFFSTTNAVPDCSEHYQYGFNANNQRWNWCNMDGAGGVEPDYLQIASSVTADGYICEASIPYGQMPSLDFSAGNTIGLHPVFDDTDNGDRELQMTWTGREAHDQSLGYGHMVLSADSAAEPEAPSPTVIWVSFHGADDVPAGGASDAGFTEAPDKEYTDLLTANGYNVMRYITTGTPDPAVLNAADLVIISRSVASGGYSNDGATAWNSISAPMIIMQGWALRSSRMGYTTGTTMEDITGDVTLTASDPTHPIFAGIPLTDNTMDNPFAGIVVYPTDGTTVAQGTSINTDPVNADGTVLATISEAGNGPVGGMVIGEWPAGATLTHAGGAETDTLAGHRLVFLTGAREADGISSETAGIYDLYPDGAQMFLNAVNYMIPGKPAPVHQYTFEDGTANDSVGSAHGTLVGDAAVVDGALVTYDQNDWMEMPGEVIAMNTFSEVTIETWFTSVAGGNTGFHMLAAFGEEGTGAADWAGYKYLFISPARGDDVSRAAIQTSSMDDSPWDDETGVSATVEHDDGLEHHFVATVNATDITFYIDGVLIGSEPLAPGNEIAGIGQAVAYLGKGVYPADPLWIGSVEELSIYNRALSLAEVQANYAAGPQKVGLAPVDPGTEGLMLHMPLDTASRGVTQDSSGNNLDGTLFGDPTFVEGVVVMAMDFDGDGDYVDCGNDPILDITGPISMSIWIRPGTDGSVETAPLCKADASAGWSWQLRYGWNTDKPTIMGFQFNATGGSVWVYVEQELPIGQWYHIAASHDGATVKCYLDGVQTDSAPMTDFAGGPSTLLIGSDGWGSDWIGAIDEVMIYNRALSDLEILYLAGNR